MPFYFYDNEFTNEFGEDYNQEFGNPKPNRKLILKKPAKNKLPTRKPVKNKLPTRKPATKKPAAKTRYSLTSDNLALAPTDNYRGYEQSEGTGLSSSYSNPLSVNYLPPPPPMPIRTATVKQGGRADSIFGLASQIISGYSRNPTVQTANGQIPIYNTPNNPQPSYGNSNYPADSSNDGGTGANVGASLGSGFDGVISWASSNPLIVLGGAVGLYLLFIQPPKFGGR